MTLTTITFGDKSDHQWSIDLGFKGKTPKKFYEKLAVAKQVRARLKADLISFLLSLIVLYGMVILVVPLFFKIVFLILSLLVAYATYKNIKMWYEIFEIQNERRQEALK